MRYVLYALIGFFMLSLVVACGGPVQKRKAEISVAYDGEVVHRAGGKYVSEHELDRLLSDKENPVRVIFTTPWCGPCKQLEKFIKHRGLEDKVVWVNAEDKWASHLAWLVGVETYPTMLISYPNGDDGWYVGVKEIAFYFLDL